MKRKELLRQLKKTGKLALVEPSNHVMKAYLKKSENSLLSAKLLQKNNLLEESVSMAYYSMYYNVLALFFKTGIKCENHSIAIWLIKKIFHLDNSALVFAKKERIDKQYYVDFSVSKKDVNDLVAITERFNATIIDFVDRLNNDKVDQY